MGKKTKAVYESPKVSKLDEVESAFGVEGNMGACTEPGSGARTSCTGPGQGAQGNCSNNGISAFQGCTGKGNGVI